MDFFSQRPRGPFVRVLGENGEQFGVLTIAQGLEQEIARDARFGYCPTVMRRLITRLKKIGETIFEGFFPGPKRSINISLSDRWLEQKVGAGLEDDASMGITL